DERVRAYGEDYRPHVLAAQRKVVADASAILAALAEDVRAHVTRLQAELDAERQEHAETERISQQEELRANEYATQLVAAQSELAKARELNESAKRVIEQFMPNVGKCFGIDFMLLNETLIALAHQSAPVAKDEGDE
uniref:hypothetical protein n=1 Tax=Pseudomonas bohemica TaxID=2044872 RepID=UPI0018FE08D9